LVVLVVLVLMSPMVVVFIMTVYALAIGIWQLSSDYEPATMNFIIAQVFDDMWNICHDFGVLL
jgi:hypothetical protein